MIHVCNSRIRMRFDHSTPLAFCEKRKKSSIDLDLPKKAFELASIDEIGDNLRSVLYVNIFFIMTKEK